MHIARLTLDLAPTLFNIVLDRATARLSWVGGSSDHATVPFTARSHSFSLISRTNSDESVSANSSSLLITTRRRPSLSAAATMLCAAVISAAFPVMPRAATRTPKGSPRFRSLESNQFSSALPTLADQFLHSTRMGRGHASEGNCQYPILLLFEQLSLSKGNTSADAPESFLEVRGYRAPSDFWTHQQSDRHQSTTSRLR